MQQRSEYFNKRSSTLQPVRAAVAGAGEDHPPIAETQQPAAAAAPRLAGTQGRTATLQRYWPPGGGEGRELSNIRIISRIVIGECDGEQ